MRSLIIIEVEHGDSTDNLDQFIADAVSNENWVEGLTVNDWTVRVDIPSCFRLDKGEK